METNIKGNIKMDKEKVKVYLRLRMEEVMKEVGLITRWMVKVENI